MNKYIESHRRAVLQTLAYCKIFGADFKKDVVAKKENGKLVGFHVIHESGCTAVATVDI